MLSASADLDELAEALNAVEVDFFAVRANGVNGIAMDEYFGINLTNLPHWGKPPTGIKGLFSWDDQGRGWIAMATAGLWILVASAE